MEVYIIAEAGQNHNGDLNLAKKLIDMANMPILDTQFNQTLRKVNAIKFTKRDLTEELTKEAYDSIYDSPHSFGRTYGQHREALELSYEQHEELYHYANERDLDFIETLTSLKTVKLVEKVKLKYIKVASRDLTNIQLLDEIAKTKIPIILSTGMSGTNELDDALETISRYHSKIVILHCLSQYPAEYQNLNLNSIPFLKNKYPDFKIGYSDHSVGISVPIAAVALGAEYIEKHVTLDHNMKGSDHLGSLEPDGLWRMTRDIRNIEKSFGDFNKNINESVRPFKYKLERSLCTNKVIKSGQKISEEDLIMLSPGGGLNWSDRNRILGKTSNIDIDENSQIAFNYFENV